jgi:hypothetical protein
LRIRRAKLVSAGIGGAAAVAMVIGGSACAGPAPISSLRAGSGDSATGTNYISPTVPAITITPAMSTGATVTPSAAPTTTSATVNSPTVTASAVAPCSSNGVVLPGGCH